MLTSPILIDTDVVTEALREAARKSIQGDDPEILQIFIKIALSLLKIFNIESCMTLDNIRHVLIIGNPEIAKRFASTTCLNDARYIYYKKALLVIANEPVDLTYEDFIFADRTGIIVLFNKMLAHFNGEVTIDVVKTAIQFIHKLYPLHDAVKTGNIGLIKLLYKDCQTRDNYDKTPIFYAQNKETIDYFLSKDPSKKFLFQATNFEGYDLIERMRQDKTCPAVIKYVKELMGFNKEMLEDFYQNVKPIFEQEFTIARKYGKKILIILGEEHDNYRICQVKKILLKIANELGLQILYLEKPFRRVKVTIQQIENNRLEQHESRFIKNAYQKHKMTVRGIDSWRKISADCTPAGMRRRNKHMYDRVLKKDQEGILIVGACHLYGLLQEEQSNLSESVKQSQYYVIPLCLTMLSQHCHLLTKVYSKDTNFKFSWSQVPNVYLSGPNLILSHDDLRKATAFFNPLTHAKMMQDSLFALNPQPKMSPLKIQVKRKNNEEESVLGPMPKKGKSFTPSYPSISTPAFSSLYLEKNNSRGKRSLPKLKG